MTLGFQVQFMRCTEDYTAIIILYFITNFNICFSVAGESAGRRMLSIVAVPPVTGLLADAL